MTNMPEHDRIERLDQALDELLAGGVVELPVADAGLAGLLEIAQNLQALPRPEFRSALQHDLERTARMRAAQWLAEAGMNTITPYLVVERPEAFLEFLSRAFGAVEVERSIGSAGGLHASLRIGDSLLMAGGGAGIAAVPAALHLYVEDADAVYAKAVAAGASSLYAPIEQPYGDREAGIKDAAGNFWYVATHRGERPIRAGFRSLTLVLHPRGSAKLIEFLERAFDAERIDVAEAEGIIVHAQLQIGDSMVEIGEARGPIPPMSCMIYVGVEDVDAAYARALGAGATTIEPPADQPYGHRRAAVQDPYGNKWYFAAPVRSER
jgi:uncharacterized glyoxalase superfamily protein PhnB